MTLGQSQWVGTDSDRVLDGADARIAGAGAWATNSSDTHDVRYGIVWEGGANLLSGTSGLTVNVAPHHFLSTKGRVNGPYLGANKSDTAVTVPAAPSLGSKRIDVIWVRQKDKSAIALPDSVTAAEYGVATGVASSSPSKPARGDTGAGFPADATEVGTVTWDSTTAVGTATNASVCTLATTGPYTVPRGAPIPVRDFVDRDATIPFPYLGMIVMWVGSAGSGYMERFDGTAWRPLFPFRQAEQAVVQPALIAAGAVGGPYAQTFPESTRFTQAPRIQFGVVGSRLVAYATSITTTGFNLYLRNVASSDSPNGAETISWTATQMTPNTANG
jgi:hypothetical protein